jgi:hypothetical protein
MATMMPREVTFAELMVSNLTRGGGTRSKLVNVLWCWKWRLVYRLIL